MSARTQVIDIRRLTRLYDIETAARVFMEFWDEDEGFCCAHHANTAVETLAAALKEIFGMSDDLMHRDLTKWPLLLVEGAPVTPAQANEIILRTTCWPYIGGNDHSWEKQVREVFGLPTDEDYHLIPDVDARMAAINRKYWAIDDLTARIGGLDLEYLYNSRITSSWIGGPHGWCDWTGYIGCGSHNIGKWPTVEEVDREWSRVAEAFPFLRLRAQLCPDEGECGPVVEWEIRNGVATLREPGPQIRQQPLNLDKALMDIVAGTHRERGVSLERLREAAAQLGVLA